MQMSVRVYDEVMHDVQNVIPVIFWGMILLLLSLRDELVTRFFLFVFHVRFVLHAPCFTEWIKHVHLNRTVRFASHIHFDSQLVSGIDFCFALFKTNSCSVAGVV